MCFLLEKCWTDHYLFTKYTLLLVSVTMNCIVSIDLWGIEVQFDMPERFCSFCFEQYEFILWQAFLILLSEWLYLLQMQSQRKYWITRQIWGIWKLRPAYSPETPNLGQNRWCFFPCDLEIWWMTLENNRASLLCCFKLCATFHSHQWIQTGVTVRKRPIWVKFDNF